MLGRRIGVATVELSGPDTRRFANGMFTNKVTDLEVGAHRFAALTDDRGRIQTLVDLVMLADDRLLCIAEGPSEEALLTMLGRFVVFDDVRLHPRGGTAWIATPDVQRAFRATSPAWPSPRVPGAVEFWAPTGAPPQPPWPPERLELSRIEQGWPRFPVDASSKQLPQELGLGPTHLHFAKGCYRGQETINRLEVRGQIRKKLVRLLADGPIAPGTPLLHDGVSVGRMGSSAHHPERGWIGLAVLRHPAPPAVTAATGVGATVLP